MTVTGTREWAEHSLNVCCGCSHGCLYCYAKEAAIRYKRKAPEDWTTEEINRKAIEKGYGKRKGRIMIPTTHDLTERTWAPTVDVVNALLAAGNELLIVSKPKLSIMQSFCHNIDLAGRLAEVASDMQSFRDRVTFRFTIGSYLDGTLSFWEPGAPNFADRLAALAWCHGEGWRTSVSCEPMLEPALRMIELVAMLSPVVTDSIWLGKLNNGRQRCRANNHGVLDRTTDIWLDRLEGDQADDQIKSLYHELKGNPKVKWKDSIKRVVGLELATKAGADE